MRTWLEERLVRRKRRLIAGVAKLLYAIGDTSRSERAAAIQAHQIGYSLRAFAAKEQTAFHGNPPDIGLGRFLFVGS